PSYSFDVTSTEMSREVLPGTTATFTFKLRNMGNLSDTYILTALTSLPSGWTYDISKETVTLEEDEQITIGISIIVPDDSAGSLEGTVTLTIKSTGSQESEILNFNVNTVEEQNKFVLLELITSANCVYCPFAENAMEDILLYYPGKVVVLEYHVNDALQTSFSSERISKYSVGGYPVAMIDGNKKISGGNSNTYNEYASAVELNLAEDLLVRIQATMTDSVLEPGKKVINALIKPQGIDSSTSVDVVFVSYRNGVSISSKTYNYVTIDGFETRISSFDGIESVTVTLDVPDDGGVVIIVQDSETNEVYQCVML
ncbi:MAG TPA: hypothetical protein PK718_04970, partial [Candidatus Methanofastidiosa archaeon]|nr:hypothetical protein [Candidatus Methanofastidiosa archaeon]